MLEGEPEPEAEDLVLALADLGFTPPRIVDELGELVDLSFVQSVLFGELPHGM